MKKVYSLITILMMSLLFVGCDKNQTPQPKPAPGGGTEKPDPKPDPEPNPEPEKQKSELPLLTFTSNDEEILKYEEELGRKPESVTHRTSTFKGYANPDFKAIPAVAYNLKMNEGSHAILGLGKEDIENPVLVLDMLKKAGFEVEKTRIKDSRGNEMTVYIGKHKNELRVEVIPREENQFNTKIQILFIKAPEMTINKDAKDFPSLSLLLTKDVEKIEKYEAELGFREPHKNAEGEDFYDRQNVNIMFDAKPKKLEAIETNIAWANYIGTPTYGPIFINCEVRGITQRHLGKPELKEWFTLNGFDTESMYDDNGFFYAYNKERTEMAQMYWFMGRMLLQIYDFHEEKENTNREKVKATAMQIIEQHIIDEICYAKLVQ